MFVTVVPVTPASLTVEVGCQVAKGINEPFLLWLYSLFAPKTIFAVAELVKLPPELVIWPLIVIKVPALPVLILPLVSNTNSPSITAEAFVAKVILSLLVPLSVSVEPASMIHSSPTPFVTLKFWLLTVEDKVMLELLVMMSPLIVWVGTLVTVRDRPELKSKISVAAGVVLVGDQFDPIVQDPLSAPIQV